MTTTNNQCIENANQIDDEARLRSLLDQVDMAQQRIDNLLLKAQTADTNKLKLLLEILDD